MACVPTVTPEEEDMKDELSKSDRHEYACLIDCDELELSVQQESIASNQRDDQMNGGGASLNITKLLCCLSKKNEYYCLFSVFIARMYYIHSLCVLMPL